MMYPAIRDDVVLPLKAALNFMRQDPQYLDKKECPYGPVVKELLRSLAKPTSGVERVALNPTDERDPFEVIGEQLEDSIRTLDELYNGLEPKERVQYQKVKVDQLGKLIDLKEKLLNLKQNHEFRQTIVRFLEEICTKDQITDLMERLK